MFKLFNFHFICIVATGNHEPEPESMPNQIPMGECNNLTFKRLTNYVIMYCNNKCQFSTQLSEPSYILHGGAFT